MHKRDRVDGIRSRTNGVQRQLGHAGQSDRASPTAFVHPWTSDRLSPWHLYPGARYRRHRLRDFMEQAASGIGGVFGLFTGGALARMGIFALGIMPYISASIIVQLLGATVGPLQQLKKEGEQGRRKITQYTRYGTVLLATVQAYGLCRVDGSGRSGHRSGLVLPYFRR